MANGAVQRGGGGSLGQGEAIRPAMEEAQRRNSSGEDSNFPWWIWGLGGIALDVFADKETPAAESSLPQPTFSAQDYWTGNAKSQEEAALRAIGYNPGLYTDLTDLANRREAEALGISQILEPQVQAAYGAAGAQARTGAQNIYGAGQRAAGEIAGRSDAAASRAAGYLSGQGMPSTMISGVTGTSGGASFDPTQGRAYGGIAAESLGREASFAAQDLAGRGSGMGKRVTLAEMINSDANRMRYAIETAKITADNQAETVRDEVRANVAKQKSDDLISVDTQRMALAKAEQAWDESAELKELYGKNKAAYDKAVAYAINQRSKALLTQWWNQVVFYADDADLTPLLAPEPGALNAMLAAGQ